MSVWVCALILRHRCTAICWRNALAVSMLNRELHFIHHCTAENGCERRVGSISTVPNAHEARLWSKASRVEQNPAPPKKGFYTGVKVRRIQAIGIRAHEPTRAPQSPPKRQRTIAATPPD